MHPNEWTKIEHNRRLEIGLLHAFYVDHAFPRHSHDYYVLCLITRGRQSFLHEGRKYFTPAGGAILINPGEVHTGEAVDEHGFEMRCIYPTVAHVQAALGDLATAAIPRFVETRVDHPAVAESLASLHKALTGETDSLECESRLTWTLAQLIRRFGDGGLREPPLGRERKAVEQARRYIEDHYAEGIRLSDIAAHVSFSPYHLLRVFRAEVGMPPYAYLESVRIRQAQRLIEMGRPLAEVAAESGFSSQSHLTQRFKRIIGVTPGQYARHVRH